MFAFLQSTEQTCSDDEKPSNSESQIASDSEKPDSEDDRVTSSEDERPVVSNRGPQTAFTDVSGTPTSTPSCDTEDSEDIFNSEV